MSLSIHIASLYLFAYPDLEYWFIIITDYPSSNSQQQFIHPDLNIS